MAMNDSDSEEGEGAEHNVSDMEHDSDGRGDVGEERRPDLSPRSLRRIAEGRKAVRKRKPRAMKAAKRGPGRPKMEPQHKKPRGRPKTKGLEKVLETQWETGMGNDTVIQRMIEPKERPPLNLIIRKRLSGAGTDFEARLFHEEKLVGHAEELRLHEGFH